MQILHTRDGTRTGNAIIIKEIEPSTQGMKDYLAGKKLWLVETDYGNRMKLTDREIDEMYLRGDARHYPEWDSNRTDLRFQNEAADNGC